MSVEIRVLRHGDEAVLDNVASDIFDDPLNTNAVHAFLADARHHLVVALDAATVVGFISAVHYLHPDTPWPEFWINQVAVAPTHQARGIGKALLGTTLTLARDLGCREAWVLTERSNTPAMRLYIALGGAVDDGDTVMLTFQLANAADND